MSREENNSSRNAHVIFHLRSGRSHSEHWPTFKNESASLFLGREEKKYIHAFSQTQKPHRLYLLAAAPPNGWISGDFSPQAQTGFHGNRHTLAQTESLALITSVLRLTGKHVAAVMAWCDVHIQYPLMETDTFMFLSKYYILPYNWNVNSPHFLCKEKKSITMVQLMCLFYQLPLNKLTDIWRPT